MDRNSGNLTYEKENSFSNETHKHKKDALLKHWEISKILLHGFSCLLCPRMMRVLQKNPI